MCTTKFMSVTRMALASMQVCVPAESSDEEVEQFANSSHPTGIESRWAIRREGDAALLGSPERNPCEARAGCVHIMLDC